MTDILGSYNKILKKYWGYDGLKPKQFEIINGVVNEKRDVCAVLATGFGKSLCFQVPYLITKKCVIIVSPLIALMKDQENDLKKRNIPVCCLNSDNFNKALEINEILEGNYKVIYITPEYLVKCETFIRELDKKQGLSLIAIDESHCVSTWGNSFRADYCKLNCLKKWTKTCPILTLTATATKKVREDICTMLSLNNPLVVIGDFDRPNLYIKAAHKGKNIWTDIGPILDKHLGEYIIIYCKTRDETEAVSKETNKYGIESRAYHAGLGSEERQNIQEGFAFGMGINIPNIRVVIHYNCPQNLESYYQEIGRAGRDNKKSDCILFYSTKDFVLNRLFLDNIKDRKHRDYQELQIRNIERYVHTSECRRKLLLKGFDETLVVNNCNNCDNCCRNIKDVCKKDFSVPAYQLLNTINSLDISYGFVTIINILRGSNAKTIKLGMKKLSTYGKGTTYSPDWWKLFVQLLINNNYLKNAHVGGGYGSTIQCSEIGKAWLLKIKTKYANVTEITAIDSLVLSVNNDDQILNGFSNTGTTKKPDDKNEDTQSRKKWSSSEDHILLTELEDHISIDVIAKSHKRTISAIKHRQRHIAGEMYTNKKTVAEIMKVTKLTEEQVEYEIKRLKTNVITIKCKKPLINKPKVLEMDDGDENLEKEFGEFLNNYKKKL
jgi:RecQ family ATP-dependent DNA helicase